MRRYLPLFMAALFGGVMMLAFASTARAGEDGDYSDINDGYYADTYSVKHRSYPRYDRPDYEPDYDRRPNYAYGHQPRHRPAYPQHGYPGKTCAYGPFHEKRVCHYTPQHCWKARECYYIYDRKYCRYYTKCNGGGKRCHWTKKHYGGHSSCGSY